MWYTKRMNIIIRIFADGTIVAVLLVTLFALIWRVPNQARYDRYTVIVMAGVTTYLVAKVMGSLWSVEQRRPFEMLGVNPGAAYLNNPGFPSDHALLGFMLTFAVWYGTRNKKLTIIMAILTILMSIGRVLALVHTPLDIAGSLVAASVGALWYGAYAKHYHHKHVAHHAKK